MKTIVILIFLLFSFVSVAQKDFDQNIQLSKLNEPAVETFNKESYSAIVVKKAITPLNEVLNLLDNNSRVLNLSKRLHKKQKKSLEELKQLVLETKDPNLSLTVETLMKKKIEEIKESIEKAESKEANKTCKWSFRRLFKS